VKTRVSLKYEGPALDDGRMDVYEASANMIAFSEFMVAAVKVTYGDSTEAKAEVAGHAHNCFVTDLVFTLGGPVASIFSHYTPEQLWSVVKEAFKLWKHLKGQPPASIVHNGPEVNVTNNDGTIIQVKTESLTLVLNPKATESATRFVNTGLSHEGYESLRIEPQDAGTEAIAEVSKGEASYFVSVAPENKVSDNVVRMTIQIVAPVFQDGNKWRFSDGGAVFNASLLDDTFVKKVNTGERFGKGDLLDVDMHIVQVQSGMKVNIERSVTRVHRHITPMEQYPMFPAAPNGADGDQ
jgi:hypothetical protein